MDEDHRLAIDSEELRRFGYRIVDLLVEHDAALPRRPVGKTASREALAPLLAAAPPERGAPPEAVLDRLERDVLPYVLHTNHPRFFAFIPGPSLLVGAFADALASGWNVFAGTWLEAAGPTAVELATVDWLRRLCGLPDGAGGLFVSGGSVANLTALAAARHARCGEAGADDAVVYYSDQTHASVERALRILGVPPARRRVLAADEELRLPVDALARAVREDRARGLRPLAVVASAGTTSTGAVDPLRALAALCRAENLWLHVDGAYGAAARLTERGRALLDGLGEADSIAVDPHKWLFQPYECACLLVRDPEHLRACFRILPSYLEDVADGGGVNLCDYGPQLTRHFRALKLWMSLQIFGVRRLRAAIDHGLDLAVAAERRLRRTGRFAVLAPARLAIVAFRYVRPGASDEELDRINRRLVRALAAEGTGMVSSTRLGGRTALRMCTIHPRATAEDVAVVVDRLAALGDRE